MDLGERLRYIREYAEWARSGVETDWRTRYAHDVPALLEGMGRNVELSDRMARILQSIAVERKKQDEKWGANRTFRDIGAASFDERHIPYGAVSGRALALMGRRVMTEVLMEEVGEVARASLEEDLEGMHRELVQVAAVAVAMLEYLEALRDGR